MPVQTIGLKPVLVVRAGDGPGVLVNRDLTNAVAVGPDQSIVGNNPTDASILDALVGLPLDGMKDVWACTLTGTPITVDYILRAKSWNPSPLQQANQLIAAGLAKDTSVNSPNYGPVSLTNAGLLAIENGNLAQLPVVRDRVAAAGSTVANDVKTTGAPLLRNEVAVTSGATAALTAGSTATIGPFTFNTPSFEIRVLLTAAAAATICNGEMTLKWSNSGGGTELARKTFSAIASTGGHAVSITGPVRGSSLSVVFTNASTSTQNITFTYTIVASSRVAANDLYRSIAGVGAGAPSLESWAGNVMDSGILANGTPSITTGSTAARGLAAYNGPCQLSVVTGSGTNDARASISIMDTTIAANTGAIFDGFTDTKGRINVLIGMPMSQCVLNLTNSNAGTQTVSFILTSAEPNVN